MRSRTLLASALLALMAFGCASGPRLPKDVTLEDEAAPQPANNPLGGVSLAQRRIELERTQKDLVHFASTLDSLQLRREQNGLVLFKGFVDEYLGTYVDPMLGTDMHSKNPELASLDAGIRLAGGGAADAPAQPEPRAEGDRRPRAPLRRARRHARGLPGGQEEPHEEGARPARRQEVARLAPEKTKEI